jgi:hypothetical protein
MLKIISCAEKDEWYYYLKKIKIKDIFFLPEYYKINEIIIEGKTECFIFYNNEVIILYPYLKRPIRGTNLFDITSCYGYGGYIGYPLNQGISEFRAAFHEYCVKEKIVSEFIRFHPLYGNHLLEVKENTCLDNMQPVVVADFSFWKAHANNLVEKAAWKKIRKAEKNLIEVSEDNDGCCYPEFMRLYLQTMERLGASSFYFFNENFIIRLFKELKQYSKLFLSWHCGTLVGGLLILYGDEYSYNFLSCSNVNFLKFGVNDLLQWKALEWSQGQGKKKHLLGGGKAANDSLFQFKEKFSPFTRDYYIGKIIHLPEIYVDLYKSVLTHAVENQKALKFENWFPIYRGF